MKHRAMSLAIRAQTGLAQLRERAAAARNGRDKEAGEVMPWLVLTLGLLAVAALVVVAVTAWTESHDTKLNNY
jgi:hypothetical protein